MQLKKLLIEIVLTIKNAQTTSENQAQGNMVFSIVNDILRPHLKEVEEDIKIIKNQKVKFQKRKDVLEKYSTLLRYS